MTSEFYTKLLEEFKQRLERLINSYRNGTFNLIQLIKYASFKFLPKPNYKYSEKNSQ